MFRSRSQQQSNAAPTWVKHGGASLPVMLFRQLFLGLRREPTKPVVRRTRKGAILRCWVHIFPVITIATITWLNTGKGFYIGSQYTGSNSPTLQIMDGLGLQLASKVLELLVQASFTLTIMDMIRYFLIYDTAGLPLGIIGAQTGVATLSYLWSPELWGGLKGFAQRRYKWLVGLYLTFTIIVILLVGPATATLIIPRYRNDWVGGSARFWLNGNNSLLYPDVLDKGSLGGLDCQNPTMNVLSDLPVDRSRCIWSGTSAIAEYFAAQEAGPARIRNQPIHLYDSTVARQLSLHQWAFKISPENWATTVDLPSVIWSDRMLGLFWRASEKARSDPLKLNYRWGATAGAAMTVQGTVPAVRVACKDNKFSDIVDPYSEYFFPVLAEYDINHGDLFAVQSEFNTSSTNSTAAWITPEYDSSQFPPAEKPSAMIIIRIPRAIGNNQSTTITLACSVDARWAPGINTCQASNSQTSLFHANLTHLRDSTTDRAFSHSSDFGFWPANDGSWRRASLELDWLNTLTPNITAESPYRTTLTRLIDRMGLTNATGKLVPKGEYGSSVEVAIASIVTDGMSRVGLQYNDPYDSNSIMFGQIKAIGDSIVKDNIALGKELLRTDAKAAIYPPSGRTSPNDSTQRIWTIFIAGFVYKADSLSTILSLILLLAYTFVAIVHLLLVFVFRFSSDAWKSPTEMLILNQKSPPPAHGVLHNASAGIDYLGTMSQRAKLCVPQNPLDPKEVHMVFGNAMSDSSRYGPVEDEKQYGDAWQPHTTQAPDPNSSKSPLIGNTGAPRAQTA